MFKALPAAWLVSLFPLSQIAVAQTPPVPGAAQNSPPGYRSAFEGYKPYSDDKLLDWKGANENTGRIGGWRVYAKEASQPDGAAAAPDAAVKPASKAGSAKP